MPWGSAEPAGHHRRRSGSAYGDAFQSQRGADHLTRRHAFAGPNTGALRSFSNKQYLQRRHHPELQTHHRCGLRQHAQVAAHGTIMDFQNKHRTREQKS